MSNETIVKKGEQIKAIDSELADVNAQMEILKAKVDMLTSDKNRLTKEIVDGLMNDDAIAYYQTFVSDTVEAK